MILKRVTLYFCFGNTMQSKNIFIRFFLCEGEQLFCISFLILLNISLFYYEIYIKIFEKIIVTVLITNLKIY